MLLARRHAEIVRLFQMATLTADLAVSLAEDDLAPRSLAEDGVEVLYG